MPVCLKINNNNDGRATTKKLTDKTQFKKPPERTKRSEKKKNAKSSRKKDEGGEEETNQNFKSFCIPRLFRFLLLTCCTQCKWFSSSQAFFLSFSLLLLFSKRKRADITPRVDK